MSFEANLKRQARVCAQLAEDCDDPYLAERLKVMAADLAAKADELDALGKVPGERVDAKASRRKFAA
jgi:hypothetical protein